MRRFILVLLPILAFGLVLPALSAAADRGWVRGEIRLNIRTGPGTQFKIVGVAKTGDGVEIVERADNWTKVRVSSEAGKNREGWIPEGYLNPVPPPTLRLSQAEAEVSRLTTELEALRQQAESLGITARELGEQENSQAAEIEELTRENIRLRAGDRYPEWITGASILAAGMLLGSLLHRASTRRQQTRIRL
jgi:SH3 domain protein